MSKTFASNVVGIGPTWLDRRQMGLKNPLGTRCHIYEQIYSNILPCGCWDHTLNNTYPSVHGGVFSLEFSPEGSLLVAACEKRSVLMFDPLTHKRIHTVENAHLDCVNCVRFLDSRSFATCSDDFTVALWDARNLNQKVRSLRGHSNWVKNIEYSPQDGLLVTSGFDGSILTWEMNKYREDGMVYNKVFSTNGLMRTRLTPDATKMIICTTGGYLIVIHNLNLNTLSQDLDGFKAFRQTSTSGFFSGYEVNEGLAFASPSFTSYPLKNPEVEVWRNAWQEDTNRRSITAKQSKSPNMYRLMQLSQTILPIASDFTHLFHGQGKRNRVEFITDFPEGDDAEVVASLQIHPDGHSAISRNVSSNEQSEWSCIHNIEERWSLEESECTDDEIDDSEGSKMVAWPGTSTSISTTPSYIIQHTVLQNERREGGESEAGTSSDQRDLSVSPSDVWEALVAIQEARITRETDRVASEMSVGHMFRRRALDAGTQVRPASSDSQIFVTRIFSNPGSSSTNEERSRSLVSVAPIFRRNVSVNTSEINEIGNRNEREWSPHSRNLSLRFRKKLPLRQRYASLYRRSLVGQYDRTSILRKPIYNPRLNFVQNKKLKNSFKLNTNYEINETRRLENERESKAESNGTVQRCLEKAGSSGLHLRGSQTRGCPVSAHRLPSVNGASTSEQEVTDSCVNRAIASLTQDLSSLENNLNSFRESITNLEGTINSTCNALLRHESILQTINDLIGEEDSEGNNGEGSISNGSNNNEGAAGRIVASSDTNLQNSNDRVDPEEVAEDGLNEASGSGNGSLSSDPSSASRYSVERTILMGVFRAGNEDGIRGTSMRRHNIAAVTVSSPPQTTNNTPEDRGPLEINRCRGNPSPKCNKNTQNSTKRYPVVPINKKIHQNTRRLTHYVEEPNLGRGFIKELCVSPDGRIICSPFGNGIRLLSFSPKVQDIFHCYPQSPPIPLHELTLNIAHTDIVVSTKFSPYHNLLVSGCLSGKIVYYQPFL